MNESAYKTDNFFVFFFKLSNGLEWIDQNKAAKPTVILLSSIFVQNKRLCLYLFDTQINSKKKIPFRLRAVFIVRVDFSISMANKNTVFFYFIDMNENALRSDVICESLYVYLDLDLVICEREIVSLSLHSIFRHFTQYAKMPVFYLFAMNSWFSNQCHFHVFFVLLSPLATIYYCVVNILHDSHHSIFHFWNVEIFFFRIVSATINALNWNTNNRNSVHRYNCIFTQKLFSRKFHKYLLEFVLFISHKININSNKFFEKVTTTRIISKPFLFFHHFSMEKYLISSTINFLFSNEKI